MLVLRSVAALPALTTRLIPTSQSSRCRQMEDEQSSLVWTNVRCPWISVIPSIVGHGGCFKSWRQDGWSRMWRAYKSMSTGRTSPVLFSFTHSSRSLAGSTFCSSWSTGSTTWPHTRHHFFFWFSGFAHRKAVGLAENFKSEMSHIRITKVVRVAF